MADELSFKKKDLDYGLEYRGGPKDGELLEGFGFPYGSMVCLIAGQGYYRMELRQYGNEKGRVGAFWHEDLKA